MNPDALKPAFPVFPDTSGGHASAFPGITIRDYFAGKAMQGLLAHPKCGEVGNTDNVSRARTKCVVAEAYALADAMLAARTNN